MENLKQLEQPDITEMERLHLLRDKITNTLNERSADKAIGKNEASIVEQSGHDLSHRSRIDLTKLMARPHFGDHVKSRKQ